MSTSGLISVMQDGKVKYKIMVLCEVKNGEHLATHIINKGKYLSAEILLELAKESHFGCENCRIILEESGIYNLDIEETSDEFIQKCKDTFNNPHFHPSIQDGKPFYYREINIPKINAFAKKH